MVTRALVAMFAIKKITDFIGATKTAIKTLEELSLVQKLTSLVPGAGTSGTTEKVVAGGEELAATSRVARNSIGATSLIGTKSLFKGSASMLGLGKSIPLLSAGTGVATELMSNNSTGEKIGGSTGSVAGTAAGAVIGSMILPGIGTAIGGATGSALGKKLGEVIGKGAEDHFKGHPIKANVKVKTTATDVDNSKISKALQPSLKKLNKQLMLKISTDPASINKAKTQTDKLYSDMSKSINSYYKNKEARSKKDLDSLVKQGVITQAQENKRLSTQHAADEKARVAKQKVLSQMQTDTNKYYVKVQNIENGGTRKLEQIAQKYGKNSQKYENEKNRELEKAHKTFTTKYVKDEYSMNTSIQKSIQKGAKQQESIYGRLIKDKGKLNIQDLKATQKHANDLYNTSVKSADKTRDDVVNAAESKYKKTVATAKREWKENGSITHSQYLEIKRNAEKQRDDTTGAADDQYKKVTRSAHDQHAKVTSEITQQKADVNRQANEQATDHAKAAQGEMTEVNGQYSGGFDAMRTLWNGIASGLNSVLDALHKGWGKIPKIGKHARGASGLSSDEIALVGEEGFELAHNPNRGIFAFGTNGPEIRHLEAGTSILPHALSKKFISMTHGLPAYKDGKSGVITRAYDWLKDKLDDTMSFVSDGAEKAFDFIADKLGLKGFLSNYNAAQHDLMQGASDSTRKGFIDYLKEKFDKYSEESTEMNANGTSAKATGSHLNWLKQAGVPDSWTSSMAWLINTESGWNPHARNGSSGAYGIPQSLPASKLASAGKDWRDNPITQIKWMVNYIKGRYGTAMAAESFHKRVGWYNDGGWSVPGNLNIFGEDIAQPEVAINPARDTADEHILQAIQARAAKAPNSTTAQLAQVIENAKDSGQVTPIWGQRASQNIKVAAGDNSHDYTGHLDNVLDKLDTIANKSLEINGHSFSKKYEAYGSARRVQRTQQARRGLAINVNI